MKKKINYLLIAISSFALLILISYCVFIEYRERPYDDYIFTVSIKGNDRNTTIFPFQKDGDYYFLLPSYAKNCNTSLVKNRKHDIYLNDIELHEKNCVLDFNENYPYLILDNGKESGLLYFYFGSDIPTLYIETISGDIEKLKDNKELQEPASLLLVNDGCTEYNSSIEYITGRGNHSWSFRKKGWSIKLFEEVSILGMKKSNEWILISNVFDDSLGLRNYIAYSMAKEIGMEGVSDFKFVDLYINKMYQGTYMLFERISQSKEKFDIGDLDLLNNMANKTIELDKLAPIQEHNINDKFADTSYRKFNSPKDISGGYILERNVLSKTSNKDHLFTTSNEETFVVRYPSFVNDSELNYIASVVESVDRALRNDDYIDPITHKELSELIDVDSFVLKYLVDEVTKNEGAGATSAYYYKKQGNNKLYAGPVWDYDKSLGRYSDWMYPEGLSNGVLYSFGSPSVWFERLYYNKEANSIIKKYYKERIKPYLAELIIFSLDEQANSIRKSYIMNNVIWGDDFYMKEFFLPYDLIEHIGDLDYSVNYIKWWINEREKFLDEEWGIE